MSEITKIEWCDHSASPWEGCTKVSDGCKFCYAEARNHRFGMDNWGKGKPRRKAVGFAANVRKWNRLAPDFRECTGCGHRGHGKTWLEDIHKTHPAALACCPESVFKPAVPTVFPSLCDWLDDEVPIEWLAEFLGLIHDTPNLHWLLLTKRPENWRERLTKAWGCVNHGGGIYDMIREWTQYGNAPANVSIIVSVENQEMADKRTSELRKIPARIRGLSMEPLLGPVDLEPFMVHGRDITDEGYSRLDGIDWLIIGGESGPGARPCNVEWIRSLVQQGKDAGVPVFVKQLGARYYEDHCGTRYTYATDHPKGGDPAEWPEDLRIRQFPSFN